MDAEITLHRMPERFGQFRADVGGRYIFVMTAEAVVFLGGMLEQPLRTAGAVTCMTIGATVLGHGGVLAVGPRVDAEALPGGDRQGMVAFNPARHVMADGAERGVLVRHDQKFAEAVVVRFMTGRALELLVFVEMDRMHQRRRVVEGLVAGRQRGVIHQRHRVRGRKVGADP